MGDRWFVAVVVPAHDEEDSIAACIASIRVACAAAHPADAVIVVVADRCTDRTAARARSALGDAGLVVEVDVRSAGAARRVGTLVALGHAPPPHRSVWIASTDADTTVPPDWIATQLRHASHGAAGIAGLVRLPAGHALEAPFRRHYAWPPHRPHPHVHGANLGVRGDVYTAVGGWPTDAMSEDHSLWRELRAGGWPVVAATDVWVETSPRLHGRVDGGFSGDLRRIAEAGGA